MNTETVKITWANGWIHTKEVQRFECGQVVITITSRKAGCLYIFVQTQDVWNTGRTQVERVVLTPGGNVQETLSNGSMTLPERCKRMDEMSDFVKSQDRRAA